MNRQPRDIYQEITDHLIADIEERAAGWKMPWHVGESGLLCPVNVASNQPYRGVNVVSLWAYGRKRELTSSYWGTLRQWNRCGGTVRKGERAAPVVFWHIGESEPESTQEEKPARSGGKRFAIARGYSVFNADQVDGFTPPAKPCLSPDERIASADSFVASLAPRLLHGGNSAFFDAGNDVIHLPNFERFKEPFAYYAVLAHELTHWTATPHRLNRNLSGRFGTAGYAAEELIAELGSAFLMARLGIAATPRPDHAGYIAGWLDLLRRDKRAIFRAAGEAQKAVSWMESTVRGHAKAA